MPPPRRARTAGARGARTRAMPACTDVAGELEVTAGGDEPNPLLRHGPIRVAADRRHLEHADGTPFLWLGDTWWMGLCRRLRWPDDVRELAADRSAKGFNVIHLVAGLYPDMDPFDERGAGDGGFPLGGGLLHDQPGVLRRRRRAHRPPGPLRHGAVRGRLLGVLPGRGRRRCPQGALAQPDRPLGRVPGRLVCGRRSADAVLHERSQPGDEAPHLPRRAVAAGRPARGLVRHVALHQGRPTGTAGC